MIRGRSGSAGNDPNRAAKALSARKRANSGRAGGHEEAQFPIRGLCGAAF